MEIEIKSLHHIIGTCGQLMLKNIEWFKKEKLDSYYDSLTTLAKLQNDNSGIITSFWNVIEQDIQQL